LWGRITYVAYRCGLLLYTDVARNVVCMDSVCMCVGLDLGCKTAEPIEIPFGRLTKMGPWNHLLDGGQDWMNPFAAWRVTKRITSDTVRPTVVIIEDYRNATKSLHVVNVEQVHVERVDTAEDQSVYRHSIDELRHVDQGPTVRHYERVTQPVAFTFTRGRHSRLYQSTTNYHRLCNNHLRG